MPAGGEELIQPQDIITVFPDVFAVNSIAVCFSLCQIKPCSCFQWDEAFFAHNGDAFDFSFVSMDSIVIIIFK